jgi:transcription elongation factor GreB
LANSTPPPVKKRPITRVGFQVLAQEHDQLLLEERPKILQGIQIAAAEGDRSENAEYIYGRKRLRELDKRLRYLGKLLKDIVIVDPEKISSEKVCFGSTVTLMDEEGRERIYSLVGEGESDLIKHGISCLSPMAKALMGKKEGDLVVVHRPAGEIELEVLKIECRRLELHGR